MQNNNTIIIVVIIAIVVLVSVYMLSQNKSAKIAAATTELNSTPVVQACVPFTKAQQDAEKRQKQADCAKKAFIPLVGVAQYSACIRNIESSLTPIKNC